MQRSPMREEGRSLYAEIWRPNWNRLLFKRAETLLLIREIAGKELPIAVTADIGHGTDAKAILIGQKQRMEEPDYESIVYRKQPYLF